MRDNDTGATTDTRAHHHHHRPAGGAVWHRVEHQFGRRTEKENLVAGTQEISM
jgi:hypothetical protein